MTFLKEFYPKNKAPKESFVKQLELANRQIRFSVCLETYKKAINYLSDLFCVKMVKAKACLFYCVRWMKLNIVRVSGKYGCD